MRARVIRDDFAGPGGWSTALRMLGVRGEIGIEWDKDAVATARAAGHHRLHADVALVRVSLILWGYIASPPCQAWSRAGKRLGILDQPAIFAHVLEPMRSILGSRPVWIAMEQVPDVLPFWQLLARWLRELGYTVWCGALSAEEYGVPQARLRAILMAARDGRPVAPPAPTHTAYAPGVDRWHGAEPDLFGDSLQPWVSMAEALGWGDGIVNTRGDRTTPGGNEFHTDRPSWALTEKVRSWVVRTGQNSYERPVDAPAPTITGQVKSWQMRSGISPNGYAQATPRSLNEPSATVTGKHRSAEWLYVNGNQANAARRPADAPAPTIHFAAAMNDVRWVAERQSARVSVQEAAILQSFPADYPWQGSRTAQYRQVGDAIPPLLAAHILHALGVGAVPALQEAAA